jgi:non-heme chloroperoxidase
MQIRIVACCLIALVDCGAIIGTVEHMRVAHAATEPAAQRVTVQPGVQLEVLDWGGPANDPHARPLVFLSGLGDTAHVYDDFAPRFTAKYHVYGITRRGFGASSKPEPTDANYSADRLGEDVVAVLSALHLDHPVLAGHSIAGEELSWIGTHDPQKVAGLIYLDAALGFAYYTHASGDWVVAAADLRRRLNALVSGADLNEDFAQGLQAGAQQLAADMQPLTQRLAQMPRGLPTPSPIARAIMFGAAEFTAIHAPAMAIFACPHSIESMPGSGPGTSAAQQQTLAQQDAARCAAQSAAFEKGNPADPVVRIANANHYVFRSNPDLVERAMNDFLTKLPAR